MKVKITLQEEMLGMTPENPEVFDDFIASKSADAQKHEEELEALPASELKKKSRTIFPRNDKNNPIMWDYQVKGMFKDCATALQGMPDSCIGTAEKAKKMELTRYMYKLIFIKPRKIVLRLPEGGSLGECSRSLRAETLQGDRIALACSETVPAGTVLEFEIIVLNKKLTQYVKECLDYGALRGLGQWRNSGKGIYSYEITEE